MSIKGCKLTPILYSFQGFKVAYRIAIFLFGFFILLSQPSVTFAEEYDDDFFELESDFGKQEEFLTIYDPLETFNRKIFYFNEGVDKYLMKPINVGYRLIIPKIFRKSINNISKNLSRPFDVINSLIQGDIVNARASFSSLLINSTIGLLGIFDVAKSKNITFEKKSFGSTLAHYNVSRGPYLMLPFLGPSDARNFSGILAEKLVDPLSINVFKIGGSKDLIKDAYTYELTAISVISQYDQITDLLKGVRKDSFDLYATIRVAYLQSQNN